MSLSVFDDAYFMKEAFKEAQKAFEEGEIPVGAVVVCRNRVIARGYNQTEKLNDVTAHAEMIALTAAANAMGAKYLNECTLYVTLEPCIMCAGALYWAHLGKLVISAGDSKRGYTQIPQNILHPKTEVIRGVMLQETEALLKQFFLKLRE